ncbi:MAG: hypothetical protein FJ336_06475 [Sphingomonadales bacterium]|nr:hypothetical protein [Sphingomonadales bacterium]
MSNEYKGEKILISSERLVFNSTNDDIQIKAKGIIHLTAGDSVRLDIGPKGTTDSSNFFIINSPYIQLGYNTKGRTIEPVTKADALETTVNDQNDAVATYSKMMDAAVAFPPLAVVASAYLNLKMANVKNALAEPGNVKSDTVAII